MNPFSVDLPAILGDAGYAFLQGAATRRALLACGDLTDWEDFKASWNDLATDTYMADGGRYRRRRHALYTAAPGEAIIRAPHAPHYQGRDYNALNGGVERWFEPITPTTADGASMRTILGFCRALFDRLQPDTAWHIELHQFRIEAAPDAEGRPTPEGMHRDGVDWVLVLMIDRHNIASGETTIHDLDRHLLGGFTLTAPLDAALVHDRRVYHGVTAVTPLDPTHPAHRDVLVLTFRGR